MNEHPRNVIVASVTCYVKRFAFYTVKIDIILNFNSIFFKFSSRNLIFRISLLGKLETRKRTDNMRYILYY